MKKQTYSGLITIFRLTYINTIKHYVQTLIL